MNQPIWIVLSVVSIGAGLWLARINDHLVAELNKVQQQNTTLQAENNLLLKQLSNDHK